MADPPTNSRVSHVHGPGNRTWKRVLAGGDPKRGFGAGEPQAPGEALHSLGPRTFGAQREGTVALGMN